MSNVPPDDKNLFEQTHEEHRKAQQKRFAQGTTTAQRLEWLEQALKFLHAAGIDYIANKHKIAKISPSRADK